MAKQGVKKLYRGWIALKSHREGYDILFVGGTKESWLSKDGSDEPLADRLVDDISQHGSFLSVRYWISDAESTLEEAQEGFIQILFGAGNARYNHVYSEITGYLWTNEDLKVGGHDLLDELKSSEGKFLNLEIEFFKEKPKHLK